MKTTDKKCQKCQKIEATHLFVIRDTIPGTNCTYEFETIYCAAQQGCAQSFKAGDTIWNGRAKVLERKAIEGAKISSDRGNL